MLKSVGKLFMNDLNERLEIELEQIEKVLKEIPNAKDLPYLSTIEIAGTAAFIHNFYNGLENILKQILKSKSINVPKGPAWHQNLLDLCEREKIISVDTKLKIGEYLSFRHFFSHAYAFDLYPDRLVDLVKEIKSTYKSLIKDIEKFKN
jgi:hypothetical protein